MKPQHKITNIVSKHMRKAMEKQDYKGLDTYEVELDPEFEYDWDEMADEELADYLKYRECARIEKERAIELLEEAVDIREDKAQDLVQQALEILTKGR